MAQSIDSKVEREDISKVKAIIKDFFKKYPEFVKKSKSLAKNSSAYLNLSNYIPHCYFEQTNGKILNGNYIDLSLKEMGYKIRE